MSGARMTITQATRARRRTAVPGWIHRGPRPACYGAVIGTPPATWATSATSATSTAAATAGLRYAPTSCRRGAGSPKSGSASPGNLSPAHFVTLLLEKLERSEGVQGTAPPKAGKAAQAPRSTAELLRISQKSFKWVGPRAQPWPRPLWCFLFHAKPQSRQGRADRLYRKSLRLCGLA